MGFPFFIKTHMANHQQVICRGMVGTGLLMLLFWGLMLGWRMTWHDLSTKNGKNKKLRTVMSGLCFPGLDRWPQLLPYLSQLFDLRIPCFSPSSNKRGRKAWTSSEAHYNTLQRAQLIQVPSWSFFQKSLPTTPKNCSSLRSLIYLVTIPESCQQNSQQVHVPHQFPACPSTGCNQRVFSAVLRGQVQTYHVCQNQGAIQLQN